METRSEHPATRPAHRCPVRVALAVTAALLPLAGATAATIYRTTAPDGSVVFSDRPAPDATIVRTRRINIFGSVRSGGDDAARHGIGDGTRGAAGDVSTAQEPDANDVDDQEVAERSPPDLGAAVSGIERVEIASPPPDAVLIDAAGPLLVEIGTAPGSLRDSGLRAEILLDDELAASGVSSMLAIPPPERGEHRLQVRLVEAGGRVVVSSEPQSLHVRQSVAGSVDDVAAGR